MSRLSDSFEQRPVGAVFSSIRSRKQLRFPSGPQFTESALESAIVDQLAFSPFVKDLVTQATIGFEHEGRPRRYSADVFVAYDVPGFEPERFMIEAKRQEDVEANAAEHAVRFAAAHDWCRSNGAAFCLLDERDIKTTYLANVRRLAESRDTTVDEAARLTAEALQLPKGSTVASALASLEKLGIRAADAIVAIEKAVIERTVDCDLTKPFGMDASLRRRPSVESAPERADPFLAILRKAARRGRS